MDLLKKEAGSTILESLVVILLLGILVTITTLFFTIIFNNSNSLKTEALMLAQQEISRSISESNVSDTLYFNETGNLKVQRVITSNADSYTIEILVSKSSTDSSIIALKAIKTK